MTLKEFIQSNDVESTDNLIGISEIQVFEKNMNVNFGGELIKYLVKYGYLAFSYVEFYGINTKQALESDMVKQTLYLHKYFPKTLGFVALENQGDGDYYIVNSADEVYEYDVSLDQLSSTGKKLFEYILDRFLGASQQ